MNNKTLLTDLYQLTMNAAYQDNSKEGKATFDLFVRKLPKDWSYFLAAGIEDAIDYATNIEFTEQDIADLRRTTPLPESFLQSLKDFRFEGEIYALREGTPFTENEPIVRVTSTRSQAQLLESTLLNIINFQTLVASKSNRIVNAADRRPVVDFGLRRAQGEDASLVGARASYLGGFVGTSNVRAGITYNIPIVGTHAHSFVMSFPTELDAFRAYVKTFPDNSTLLIDTYNIEKGAINASIVAKELEASGHKLKAVRIDSDPLSEISVKVRKILDQRGLEYVKITATNDLNEYKIQELRNSPIDSYGVGTENITGKPIAAIPGVYKIVEDEEGGKIKLSSCKKTYPGKKQIYRLIGADGFYSHDILALESECIRQGFPLLEKIVENGVRIIPRRSLAEIRQYALSEVSRLSPRLREISGSDRYQFECSEGLDALTEQLTKKYTGGN